MNLKENLEDAFVTFLVVFAAALFVAGLLVGAGWIWKILLTKEASP